MKTCVCFSLTLFAALPMALPAGMSVAISPSVTSPAPLGTLVTWTATVSGAGPGTLSYRFRTWEYARVSGRAGIVHLPPQVDGFRTVVDYGPKSSLDWSSIDHEGVYYIEVSVKNNGTGELAQSLAQFALTSLVRGGAPVVTPTRHPLVFIYSAPTCALGSRMRVQFQSPEGLMQSTPYRPCDARFSMNFYLAGMRPDTLYTAQHVLDNGNSAVPGPQLTLTTSSTGLQPPHTVALPATAPASNGILLQSILSASSIATDLHGNIVWYSPAGLSLLTRVQAGGTFLGILDDGAQDTSHQFFREFDLAGVTLAETNAGRINEQLASMGVHPITCFHHEAIRLPDGKYLVLAGSERILTDVQGPGPVDILGDTILVLDSDLQVAWTWDAFDHLDPHRAAILGEACAYPATLACSTFYQATSANDWLHGNALQLTPDGNILYSVRHQDWIVKIDYANGRGSGAILWRLGAGGDFQINSSVFSPWFSHQHDPHFESDNTTLLLFDNGNTRIFNNNEVGNSRGQVLRIDEASRVATLLLNADLGVSASALGTAQQLSNGHYHFDASFIADPAAPPNRFSQALEVDASGNIVWGVQISAVEYRSFRLSDLYTPPIQ